MSWYLSSALKPVGPFDLVVLQDKIKKGQLGPHDLVFHQQTQEWKPAIQWTELRHLGFPAFEALNTENAKETVWIVLHLDPAAKEYQQEGPFSANEVSRGLVDGKYKGEDLVWKKGLSGWARLSDRLEFIEPAL